MGSDLAVEMVGIHKRFAGVHALRGADLHVRAGTVHALIGANGAGKSTLGRILGGALVPDAGEVRLFGRRVSLHNTHDAMAAGVGMVPQEPLLAPNMTVADNLVLGREIMRGGRLDRGAQRAECERLLAQVGLEVDPDTPVAELNVAGQQLVQVARALGRDARVLILDEPTSAITAHESERLFSLMDQLTRRGVTIVYVSHRLAEVVRLADEVTVVRDGQTVATYSRAEVDEEVLIARMVGGALSPEVPAAQPVPAVVASAAPLLEVHDLGVEGQFSGVSFELYAGEVLGIAGLVGAGRSELAQALSGLNPPTAGEVFLQGTPLALRSAGEALERGIVLVPEDRRTQGLIPQMSVRENISLSILSALCGPAGQVRRAEELQLAESFQQRLSLRCRDVEQPVRELSGGNQQKVLLARALACRPRILILDEPTRGVDVGAKADIHRWIRDLAAEGMGVLLISSELEEVIALSDRILVLREGRVVTQMPTAGVTEEQLLALAAREHP